MKRKRKTYKQKSKRRNARWRDNHVKNISVFTFQNGSWNSRNKRQYYIVCDKTGNYISNKWSEYVSSTPKTQDIKYAQKFTNIDTIIRVINQLKHTGAWRTMRI